MMKGTIGDPIRKGTFLNGHEIQPKIENTLENEGRITVRKERDIMPYKDAKFKHIRRRPPSTVDESTYYTVPISHTRATGTYPKGTIARIAKSFKTGNTVIQAILIPLKRK